MKALTITYQLLFLIILTPEIKPQDIEKQRKFDNSTIITVWNYVKQKERFENITISKEKIKEIFNNIKALYFDGKREAADYFKNEEIGSFVLLDHIKFMEHHLVIRDDDRDRELEILVENKDKIIVGDIIRFLNSQNYTFSDDGENIIAHEVLKISLVHILENTTGLKVLGEKNIANFKTDDVFINETVKKFKEWWVTNRLNIFKQKWGGNIENIINKIENKEEKEKYQNMWIKIFDKKDNEVEEAMNFFSEKKDIRFLEFFLHHNNNDIRHKVFNIIYALPNFDYYDILWRLMNEEMFFTYNKDYYSAPLKIEIEPVDENSFLIKIIESTSKVSKLDFTQIRSEIKKDALEEFDIIILEKLGKKPKIITRETYEYFIKFEEWLVKNIIEKDGRFKFNEVLKDVKNK